MADETKDLSKQEQLSIVVRYVESTTIKERFLTYFPADNLNAESLSKYILDTLKKYDLDPQMIVSQGYDGASVMSGNCSGVQQRIRQVAQHAAYIHCQAHTLNLVLVDCAKNNSSAFEFFSLVESLYVFISTSKAHVVFIEKQTKELQRLSETRWACRSLALDAIASTYDSIIATLEHFAEDCDKTKAGLLHQIRTFKFLATLIIFQRLMSVTKALSDQLQSETIDLSCAAGLVLSTSATLKDLRSDETWDHTYEYIRDVAELNHIEESTEDSHRRRQLPRRLQDSIAFESTGHRDLLSCSQSIKVNIYFPVLDHILSELDRRFSTSNLDLFKSLDACNPTSSNFLDSSLISSFASLYGLNDDAQQLLPTECLLARRTLESKQAESVSEVYTYLLPLESGFPTLKKLFQIALTLVVSTAQCERSFSALARIKTHLRTTMTNHRLADISLLSLENDLCSGPSFLEDTVRQFEGSDKNISIVLS